MEFTDAELVLIAAAKHKVKWVQRVRIGVIILLLLGTLALLADLWSHPYAIYIAFALVVFAVALPQFGQGPKYEELLELLLEKSSSPKTNV
ncbi:hypothetical protein HRJ35_14180 [Shewanella oneidensis MR-1]|uniref:Uncharacterized protein n=1 Tax=Shewanella oneidensis (strain ATCC 700550 / JCM 31522 / CIP 106686 / LMG 19005 / NCIMB 14063 / MR-1) TaxID=211586 RepID=Q8EE74_SHEON|nr:hypothetical protein [Shewanella oneidensis]AAN55546.1 uncharacterized protein SO_2515 [Shewanella oneidensis MR-1]MDX5995804.1 hypothetical protein [Shewanella oneidensis]MEE2029479.1 hypothetical protein [Shewanella oneidensis]QKG97038.1 hypothetical protein HRJ35_14180 [Shewanella oneidensis MR-1]